MTSKFLYALTLVGVVSGIGDPLADASTVAAAPAASAAGTVYTADEKGGTISAIDLSTGQVESIPVPIVPHNVQISADGQWLYAVGMGMAAHGTQGMSGHGQAGGRLVILDSTNVKRGPTAEIEIGPHPAHVVTSSDGKLAFVTDSKENVLQVVDLPGKRIVRTIPTGAYPHGLRESPDERELYVANVKDGSVSIIDIVDWKEAARIKVGKSPVQVGFTPDGSKVYVSLKGENKVAVIDRLSRQSMGTLPVGRGPVQVYATPNSKYVYVANQGSDRKPDSTASVIDVAANTVVAKVVTGIGAHGVVVSSDGRFAFVSNIADSTVSEIDTATHRVVRNFKVGAGPNGITFRPDVK
jgi:YVTN family beta-propeller protein